MLTPNLLNRATAGSEVKILLISKRFEKLNGFGGVVGVTGVSVGSDGAEANEAVGTSLCTA